MFSFFFACSFNCENQDEFLKLDTRGAAVSRTKRVVLSSVQKKKTLFLILFRVSSSSIFFSLIVKKMVGEKNKIKIKYRKRESNKKDDDSDFKR